MPSVESLRNEARDRGERYREFLRSSSLSAGLYVLGAGATDAQRPHTEDEIYYVVRGRGRFRSGTRDGPVGPGEILFVPARQEHRFYDIEEELVLLVVFAPPEGARAPSG